MSARRKWIDMGNGVRRQVPTKAEAAQYRRLKAQNAAMARRIEADSLPAMVGPFRGVPYSFGARLKKQGLSSATMGWMSLKRE